MISFSDKVSVPAHVIVRFVDKEAVLLNLQTEQYSGLDETGTWMWRLATSAVDIEGAYWSLIDQYNVDAETLRQNLSALLEELIANGLLTVIPSNVGTTSTI